MDIKFSVLLTEGNSERAENVKKMREQIQNLNVIVANKENVFDKHTTLFGIEPRYDGTIIFEDDVQLCKNFILRVGKILNNHKNDVVSMFENALTRKKLHSEYRTGSRFSSTCCNYYPRNVCEKLHDKENIEQFVEYFNSRLREPWNYPIDTYIAYVLKKCKIKYWMEVPFFVQHLDFKSNFPGRPSNRQSKYFIDDVEGQE